MPFTEPRFADPALNGSTFVLERRVNRPSQVVAKTLRDRSTVAPADGFALEDGTLVVDDPPRLSRAGIRGRETWRTTGQLMTDRGRLVSRLDIEVGEWTSNSVFIQMRPVGSSPRRWSPRRTRRYFALAHAGADRLERVLSEQMLDYAPASGGGSSTPIDE